MRRIINFFPFLLIFSGCFFEQKEPIDGTEFSKNFIQVYIVVDDMMQCFYDKSLNTINIFFDGEMVSQRGNTNYGNPTEERFNALSNYYEDITFNRKLVPYINYAVLDQFSINVTCDRDFNNYPAKTSLNEIIEFIGSSPYKFIKSGYNLKYDWSETEIEKYGKLGRIQKYGYHLVNKKMSEITISDMILLNQVAYLTFTEKPVSGEYTFTITLKSEDKEFVRNINITFE